MFRSHIDNPAREHLSTLKRGEGHPGYRAYVDPETGKRGVGPSRKVPESRALGRAGKKQDSDQDTFDVQKLPDGSLVLHMRPDQQPRVNFSTDARQSSSGAANATSGGSSHARSGGRH